MSRRSRQVQQQLGLAAMVIGVAVAAFVIRPGHTVKTLTDSNAITAPTWYIVKADRKTYGIDGFITTSMVADKVVHHDNKNLTTAFSPLLTNYLLGKVNRTVVAKTGTIDSKKNIEFNQDVVLTLHSDKENSSTVLKTQSLSIDTLNKRADTAAPVTILQGSGKTEAIGLHADLNLETLSLLSRVHTIYAP